jgi:hypothetical protein
VGLIRGITSKLLGGPKAGPRVTIAAFGKHPAWSDHIEPGIGDITENIADLKKRLYYVGIKKVIDSGQWMKLSEENRLPGFNHEFVMALERGVIVGRMWSSSDARGRSEFPMVAVAETEGLGVGTMCSLVLPRLFELEATIRDLRDENAVRGVVAGLDESIGISSRALNSLTDEHDRSFNAILHRFFSSSAFGPDAVGLLRILRVIERATSTRISKADSGVLQIRVPRTEASVIDDMIDWSRLIRRCLRGVRPVYVLAPTNGRWLDVIAGPASDGEFFCLRAAPGALAYDSDTPYELDRAFTERWRSLASTG